ncbi:MAG: hypothetical protein ACHBN1_10050 [Heteroscytonema crispum UTEX LB 1556]
MSDCRAWFLRLLQLRGAKGRCWLILDWWLIVVYHSVGIWWNTLFIYFCRLTTNHQLPTSNHQPLTIN